MEDYREIENARITDTHLQKDGKQVTSGRSIKRVVEHGKWRPQKLHDHSKIVRVHEDGSSLINIFLRPLTPLLLSRVDKAL
jgi:hypothetical protein